MTAVPRAILFDLDDTIITFGSRPAALLELAREFSSQLGPITPAAAAAELDAACEEYWSDAERYKAGRFKPAEARAELVEAVFAGWRTKAPGLTKAVALQFAARFHAARHDCERAWCFPGALDTLDAFKRRGVKLALVTNGSAELQRAKVAQFDLAHHFEHIQIEGEAGFGKPEEQAYLHAMAALDVEAHETWMVGDNLEWEVTAPQRLGIYAIWHDHAGRGLPAGSTVRPDRIVKSIAELIA